MSSPEAKTELGTFNVGGASVTCDDAARSIRVLHATQAPLVPRLLCRMQELLILYWPCYHAPTSFLSRLRTDLQITPARSAASVDLMAETKDAFEAWTRALQGMDSKC